MLVYWYNAPRHIKLIFIIVVCAAIYAANQVQPLSSTYTVLSLVLGFGLHFGQYLQKKFQLVVHINLTSSFCLGFTLSLLLLLWCGYCPLSTIGS